MTTNGELPENWSDFPTERRTAANLGLSVAALKALYADLNIKPLSCRDRTVRLLPDDVESLASLAAMQKDDKGAEGAAAAALRVATAHAKDAFKLALDQAKNALDVQLQVNQRQADRIKELETLVDAQRALRDDMLSEQTARDIAKRESEKRLERQGYVFKLLADRAPKLFDQLQAVPLGKALLDTITPEQVDTLLAFEGFLSPTQKELLVQMRALPSSSEKTTAAEAAPTEETP